MFVDILNQCLAVFKNILYSLYISRKKKHFIEWIFKITIVAPTYLTSAFCRKNYSWKIINRLNAIPVQSHRKTVVWWVSHFAQSHIWHKWLPSISPNIKQVCSCFIDCFKLTVFFKSISCKKTCILWIPMQLDISLHQLYQNDFDTYNWTSGQTQAAQCICSNVFVHFPQSFLRVYSEITCFSSNVSTY